MAEQLCAWYQRSGRDLPWRHSRDPYRIWLSEIMLQQTTVGAVIDYYQRFLAQFPTVQTLAAANLDDVLTLWAGLGYYSRARNLHRAAQQIVTEYDGQFPCHIEALQRLPGIGRSTAGAISCLAFDQPAPILDGNVRRVLCRLLAIADPPRQPEIEKRLWDVAGQLVPERQAHDYTQAIMDLGATLCTPKRPACQRCPLADLCLAHARGQSDQLPMASKRPAVPTRYQAIVLINDDGQTLLRRRPATGLLGGMLEFPVVELTENIDAEPAVRELLTGYGCSSPPRPIGRIRHTYSHFRLEAQVYVLTNGRIRIEDRSGLFWQADAELGHIALHGAHKKALALSRKEEGQGNA
jgi:A/G-specific adenine glycosylase